MQAARPGGDGKRRGWLLGERGGAGAADCGRLPIVPPALHYTAVVAARQQKQINQALCIDVSFNSIPREAVGACERLSQPRRKLVLHLAVCKIWHRLPPEQAGTRRVQVGQ